MTVELDVPAQMRDGVTLRSNVYRPSGSGPWPTLLMRLPYGKDGNPEVGAWLDPLIASRRGFMVVVQDTRGRFASEGAWSPFRFERQDGYDTVEWAAALPGSNGRVGMYGLSYFGNTAWMAAVERPPSLAAIAPGITWSEPLDGVFARGGALELGLALCWALETGAAQIDRLPLSDDQRQRRLTALLDDYDRLSVEGFWELPVAENSVLRRHEMPDLGALSMLADPELPAACRVAGEHERVLVPSFNIGGWYDVFVQGTLDNYTAMSALGRPGRLVMGPWFHDLSGFSDPIGDMCFGSRASGLGGALGEHGDLNDMQLDWFPGHLTADGGGDFEPEWGPVRLFVMGRNEWRDERSWPLTRARAMKWFLRSGGALDLEASPGDEPPSEFRYDPDDPVPTLGGPVLLTPAYRAGPVEQAAVEARDDVLAFTSEPLPADLEVTGRVRLVLHAQSSAPSTDWVARLCDVHPDGRSMSICDGILRVSRRADDGGAYEIDLWSTSTVFLAGHRLRIQITSSSFPRWDRNLNTGDQHQSRCQVALQRIYHDSDRPSYVELPIID